MKLGAAYVRLWSANTIGTLGGGVYAATLPMLAATLTSEPSLVAGVAVAVELPWLLFSLIAGAIVDRADRRFVAALSTSIGAALVLLLTVLAIYGQVVMPVIYVFAFLVGTCVTVSGTATQTMAPMLVPKAELTKANSRLVAASTAGGELGGPALGGFLFGYATALPLALYTLMSTATAALLRSLPSMKPSGTPSTQGKILALFRDVVDGARWLAGHPTLRLITVLSVLFAVTDTAWFSLLALYVKDILGLPPSAYGYITGIGALGGLVGGLAAARIARYIRSVGTLLGIVLLAAAAAQGILALTSHPLVTAGMLLVSSFAFGLLNVITFTMFQQHTPTEILGRVNSANRTAIMGASPIGALLGGTLASWLGLRAPFVLGIPVLVIAAIISIALLRSNLTVDSSQTQSSN